MLRKQKLISENNITNIILPGTQNSANSNLTVDIAQDDFGKIVETYDAMFGKSFTNHVSGALRQRNLLSVTQQWKIWCPVLGDKRGYRQQLHDTPIQTQTLSWIFFG